MPELFQTPDHYFENLPDFFYSPNYMYIKGVRIHYIHEGKTNKKTLLLLHGNPTWNFYFRHIINLFSNEYQVIAPDFIGFGKSDKYARQEDYSYKLHLEVLLEFIQRMGIEQATLVGSNWGAMLGLRALAEAGERFERLVIMNTYLPVGNRELPYYFRRFREYVNKTDYFKPGTLVSLATQKPAHSESMIKGYNAPFKYREYEALSSIRKFTNLIPDNPKHPTVAHMQIAREVVRNWYKPALLLYSESGVLKKEAKGEKAKIKAYEWFIHNLPEDAATTLKVLDGVGHFICEDDSEAVVRHLRTFLGGS